MLFLKIESGWGESLIIGMHKKQVNKERRGYENIIKCILMDLSKNMLYDSILNTFKFFSSWQTNISFKFIDVYICKTKCQN